VRARGDQRRAGLREIATRHPVVAEVRGPGLMVGIELRDPSTGRPDPLRVAAVIERCRVDEHLLLMNAGTWANTIRLMPPLVVTEGEIDLALAALARSLDATR
jgi:4-aminobutyrate aminotransferase-like enzyme